MSALALKEVSVALGGARILDGVNGSVETGEWVTVIGPNGAGKSTLLRAVAGLVPLAGEPSRSAATTERRSAVASWPAASPSSRSSRRCRCR